MAHGCNICVIYWLLFPGKVKERIQIAVKLDSTRVNFRFM